MSDRSGGDVADRQAGAGVFFDPGHDLEEIVEPALALRLDELLIQPQARVARQPGGHIGKRDFDGRRRRAGEQLVQQALDLGLSPFGREQGLGQQLPIRRANPGEVDVGLPPQAGLREGHLLGQQVGQASVNVLSAQRFLIDLRIQQAAAQGQQRQPHGQQDRRAQGGQPGQQVGGRPQRPARPARRRGERRVQRRTTPGAEARPRPVHPMTIAAANARLYAHTAPRPKYA